MSYEPSIASTFISSSNQYGHFVCHMVNADYPTFLDNHVRIIDLTDNGRDEDMKAVEMNIRSDKYYPMTIWNGKTFEDTPSFPRVVYEGSILNTPTISFVPRDDYKDTLTEIYRTIFVDHDIRIDTFVDKKLINRRITEDDIVISGSTLTTTFYDVTNTSTGAVMKSDDIDVYILPSIRRIYIDGKMINNSFRAINNISVGDKKYQFISISSCTPKNVYGFYDFDICRGMIQFLKDGLVRVTFSQMMTDCISSGYAIVGFHTTDVRVAKYQSRGLGVILIKDTRILTTEKYYGAIRGGCGYNVRGFNAVRSAKCNACGIHHLDNREKIHIYQSVCKACLAKEGYTVITSGDTRIFSDDMEEIGRSSSSSIAYENIIPTEGKEVWYSGKDGNYHLIVPKGASQTEFGHRLYKYCGVMKHPGRCHKVTFPIINVAKTGESTRKNILSYLGINETVFRTGTFGIYTRKYKLIFPPSDPIFDNYRVVIDKYSDSIIYKARLFMSEENDLSVKVNLYIPAVDDLLCILVDAVSQMSDCRHVINEYTPFVTGRRYKKFENWAKAVTRRVVKKAPVKEKEETTNVTASLSTILSQRAAEDVDLLDHEFTDMNVNGYINVSDSDEE